jgi:hypothetical protein
MRKEWIITKLECKVSNNTLENVVQEIFWRRRITNVVDEIEYSADWAGNAIQLPEPNQQAFTEFNNLTREQVESWIEAALGQDVIAAIDNKLIAELEERIQPTIISLDPPF